MLRRAARTIVPRPPKKWISFEAQLIWPKQVGDVANSSKMHPLDPHDMVLHFIPPASDAIFGLEVKRSSSLPSPPPPSSCPPPSAW